MTAKEAVDRFLAFARRWTKRIDDAPEALRPAARTEATALSPH